MESSSRIAEARRLVRLARYVIGAVAVAGFAVSGAAVRDAHPATQHAGTSSESSDSTSLSFGTGSLGDSGDDVPQVQSAGS